MAITRITQNTLSRHSLDALQRGLDRMARLQEQLSSGRQINRPSDDPSGTTTAMRLRSDVAAAQQYQRNAQDGLSWLGLTDATLQTVTDSARNARDLGLQGANSSLGQTAREALAGQVDQIRSSLLTDANTTYLGRPIFGGVTAGSRAYDASGSYVGEPGSVQRTVGDGVKVRVDTDGSSVFGPAGDSVFDHLTALAAALRSGDTTAMRAASEAVGTDTDRITAGRAEAGTRYARLEQAAQTGADNELRTKNALSTVENVDLPKVVVELQMQQTAYQAALAATAKAVQPSLLDFMR